MSYDYLIKKRSLFYNIFFSISILFSNTSTAAFIAEFDNDFNFKKPESNFFLDKDKFTENLSLSNHDILFREGVALLKIDQTTKAFKKFYTLWKNNTHSPIVGILTGYTALKNKQPNVALEVLNQTIQLFPQSVEAHTLVGISYITLNQPAKAQIAFEKAQQIEPGNLDSGMNLSILLENKKNFSEAKQHIKEVIKKNPEKITPKLKLAEIEYKLGRIKSMVNILENLVNGFPKDVRPRIILCRLYLSKGLNQNAYNILKPIKDKINKSPRLLELYGIIQLKNAKYDEAVISLNEALKITSDSDKILKADLLYNIALISDLKKDYDSAITTVNHALSIQPFHTPSLFLKSRILTSLGKFDLAQKELNKIPSSLRKKPELEELQSIILLSQKKYSEAVKLLKSAFKQKPNSYLVIKLSIAQLLSQKKTEAYNTLKTWLAKHPNDIDVLSTLADLYLSDQQYDSAINLYRNILQKKPLNASVLNNLAWAQFKIENLKDALINAQKAIKLDPNNTEIMKTLSSIKKQHNIND